MEQRLHPFKLALWLARRRCQSAAMVLLETFSTRCYKSSSAESLLTTMPPVNVCCGCSSDPPLPPLPPLSPIQRPPALTPAPEGLPSLPHYSLDGAFCSPLKPASRPSSGTTPVELDSLTVKHLELSSGVHQSLAEALQRPIDLVEHSLESQDHLSSSAISLPQVRRRSGFASPGFGMVGGRSPKDAWTAVAAKVVAANRFRSGLSKEIKIKEFQIEELGGRLGPLVFGPVAIFNGNVTFLVKKPLKRVTLTVTFAGVTKLEKYPIPFYTTTQELFVGDLHEGLRSFLFGFNFPCVNLPPTSDNPLISYTFSAKLTLDPPPDYISEASAAASGGEITEYRSKNLHIYFIPYVDPALEVPRVARQPSMTRKRSKEKQNVALTPKTNTHTLNLSSASSSLATPVGGAKIPKPKLTLTTADLPITASHNSTPVIDKPNPATMSSHIVRITRITDDDNNTVAKLRVELPKSRFLPGDDIAARIILQLKSGISMPKGFGARVIETRYLAVENRVPDEDNDETTDLDDSDKELSKMKNLGPQETRVLAGKKFVLPDDVTIIPPETFADIARKSKRTNEDETADQTYNDASLGGGKELVFPVKVTLPQFKTFISESLLPTTTIPLGDPRHPAGSFDDYSPHSGSTASKGRSTPRVTVDGKGKHSSSASKWRSESLQSNTSEMYFTVAHSLQITVPTMHASWFKRPSGASVALGDLDVIVPIILGNKNPASTSKYRTPEVRLNAPESSDKSYLSEGSSQRSFRSVSRSSRSNSIAAGEPWNTSGGWKEGQRFLTMRETNLRPQFVVD